MADPVTTVAKTGIAHLFWTALIDTLKKGREHRMEGKDPESQFAEAMGILHRDHLNAWQKVQALVTDPDPRFGITDPKQRKNFRVNYGRIGGPDCQGTVDALLALAAIQPDEERRKFLEGNGYLDPHAAVGLAKQAGEGIKSGAEAAFEATVKTINDLTTQADAERSAKEAEKRSADRLADYKARRKR